MRTEFNEVHAQMRAALEALDFLTQQPQPDEAALATARLNLSRASGRRRKLFDAAVSALAGSVSPTDAPRLRELRELNAAQLQASTAHIGKWGLRAATADWPGYRAVSMQMRQSLRDLIAADRAILLPMLERAG